MSLSNCWIGTFSVDSHLDSCDAVLRLVNLGTEGARPAAPRRLGRCLAAAVRDLGQSDTRGSVVENYEIASACWGAVAAFGTEAAPVGAIGHPTADAEDRALDEFPAQPVSRFNLVG